MLSNPVLVALNATKQRFPLDAVWGAIILTSTAADFLEDGVGKSVANESKTDQYKTDDGCYLQWFMVRHKIKCEHAVSQWDIYCQSQKQ